jgi:membrane-associated protein
MEVFLEIKQFVLQFLHPAEIIMAGGLILILVIVFAETGLFFGFFLPGDSLLFTTGLMTATNIVHQHVALVLLLVILTTILGYFAGYWFGRKTGNKIFSRNDSLFFRKKHVERAKAFYDKYGSFAIVLGRFIPIARTFSPIIAGVVQLNFRRFVFYNALGAVIWVTSMILAGYFFGIWFPDIINYLELILIFFMVVTAIPLLRTYWLEKKGVK